MRINTTATTGPTALRRVQNLLDSSHDQHARHEKQGHEPNEDVAEKISSTNALDSDGLPHIDTEA